MTSLLNFTHVHVVQVDGREKPSLTGQPGGHVRCTMQRQRQPTSEQKQVNPVLISIPELAEQGYDITDLSSMLCARDKEPTTRTSASAHLPFPVQHNLDLVV